VGLKAERVEVEGVLAVRIRPKTLTFDITQRVTCTRTQLPLIPCFAATIHKAQGLTLDKVVIDCGESIFAAGMAYTALSRIRKLEDLLLISFAPHKVRCGPQVQLEFERLQREHLQDSPVQEVQGNGDSEIDPHPQENLDPPKEMSSSTERDDPEDLVEEEPQEDDW